MMKMTKVILGIILLLICALAFGQEESAIKLEIGMKAPLTELRLLDLRNEYKSLKEEKKSNGLIVVFSCNTCPFVVGSNKFEGWEKDYNDLAMLAAKHDIGFILVNSNEAKRDGDDSQKEMIAHAAELGYMMPYLIDANSTMANAFGAKTTPHVFMFDGTMKLNYKGSIDNSWDNKKEVLVPYLQQAILQSIQGQEISYPETAPKGCSIKRQ